MIDVDLNVPSFRCSNSQDYDGSDTAYKSFLTRTRPVGWRDEVAKQQNIGSKGGSDAMRSCRVKLVNMDTVLPSQVNIFFFGMHILKHRLYISNMQCLLFLDQATLEGDKRDCYVLMKLIKKLTKAEVTR